MCDNAMKKPSVLTKEKGRERLLRSLLSQKGKSSVAQKPEAIVRDPTSLDTGCCLKTRSLSLISWP